MGSKQRGNITHEDKARSSPASWEGWEVQEVRGSRREFLPITSIISEKDETEFILKGKDWE